MAEELIIPVTNDKKAKYQSLVPQIRSLIEDEQDLIANLSNICAALKYGMDFFWVGFYIVKDGGLVLGPFQGPIACTRIAFGKGVCGAAYEKKEVIIVPDVEKFPGHISCNSLSKSEIVLPVLKNDEVAMVLDVDSDKLEDFDEMDRTNLQIIVEMIEDCLK